MSEAEALKLASQSEHLYVAKGSKIVHFDMRKEGPDDKTILSHIMGPTGNLRAPTLRVGKNMLVGFNEDMYSEIFGTAKAGAAKR